jgi:hypothetical protein
VPKVKDGLEPLPPEEGQGHSFALFTSKKTQCVSSITKANQLMLFRETIAVHFKNHTNNKNKL